MYLVPYMQAAFAQTSGATKWFSNYDFEWSLLKCNYISRELDHIFFRLHKYYLAMSSTNLSFMLKLNLDLIYISAGVLLVWNV